MLLTLCGALGWALGNICSRQARAPKPLHLTLWMSVVPPLPMLAALAAARGSRAHRPLAAHRVHARGPAGGARAALHRVARHAVGYGLWNTLLAAPLERRRAVLDARAGRRRAQLLAVFDEMPDPVELIAGAPSWAACCTPRGPRRCALMGPRRPLITPSRMCTLRLMSLSKSTVRVLRQAQDANTCPEVVEGHEDAPSEP